MRSDGRPPEWRGLPPRHRDTDSQPISRLLTALEDFHDAAATSSSIVPFVVGHMFMRFCVCECKCVCGGSYCEFTLILKTSVLLSIS